MSIKYKMYLIGINKRRHKDMHTKTITGINKLNIKNLGFQV